VELTSIKTNTAFYAFVLIDYMFGFLFTRNTSNRAITGAKSAAHAIVIDVISN